ncbi:MAG: VWA domain-containing protein [Oligoflexia bacterium]|nr:VWA domain-containing protein [Oligoflexia bacterium]
MNQQYSKRPKDKQYGAVLPLFLLMFFGILAVLGLAVDLTNYYKAQVELQRAVDAGAMAGARILIKPIATGGEQEAANAVASDKAALIAKENLNHSGYGDDRIQVQATWAAPESEPAEPGAPVLGLRMTVSGTIRPRLLVLGLIPGFNSGTVLAASAQAEARAAIISLVLDNSGSMAELVDGDHPEKGTKLAALKIAAHDFVSSLRGTGRDMVALNTFTQIATTRVQANDYYDSAEQIDTQRAAMLNVIDNQLSAAGRTNASEAIFRGWESIRTKKLAQPNLPCFMIFFTDGAPNVSTANWQPPAGTPGIPEFPSPATAATKWYSYATNGEPPVYINHWYRTNGTDTYSTTGVRLLAFDSGSNPVCDTIGNCLGTSSEIRFRVPGTESSDQTSGRLYQLFPLDGTDDSANLRRLPYLTALAMGDYVRDMGCSLYTIGVGQNESITDNFYQTLNDDTLHRKDFFLNRLANDQQRALSWPDEPNGYVRSYLDLRTSKPGKYYPTEDATQLRAIFRDILTNIRLRLNS